MMARSPDRKAVEVIVHNDAVVFEVFQRFTARFSARYEVIVAWLRQRYPLFDHFWRAKERYYEVLGGRLSAAIAYYGFFAVFALAMVAYAATIKIFSSDSPVVADLDSFLGQYFTTLNTEALKSQVNNIQTIGLVSLVLAGIGWVDAFRSSLRAVWRLDQHPGNFLVLRMVDLGTLIVFALMMGISLGIADGLEQLFQMISQQRTGTLWFDAGVQLLAFIINLVIATGLMTVIPRIHLAWRRLVPSILVIAIGLTLLNLVGRYFIGRTERNPAYAIVATSVGLLVYLYLLNQIVIWAAAWAATGQSGRVFDLAWGKPREHDTLDNIPVED
jgi:membrane protein